MSQPLPATPDEAIDRLTRLPEIASMGISFIGLMPDAAGELAGHKIDLTENARYDIATVAEETRKSLLDATLLAYAPALLVPPQHWMHVANTGAATLELIEEVVRQEDLLPFDPDDGSRLKLVAARFTSADQQVVTFYRVADSLLQLKTNKVIGLFRSGPLYDRLDPSNLLLLRSDFDVVVVGGYAFFRKKQTFEQAFGFLDQLKAESLGTFNAVTSNLRIKGFEELQKACTSQPQMMAKMSSIKRSLDADPQYAAAMTMPKLLEYIRGHDHVDIDIEGSGNDAKLVFDPTPRRRFQILKLLDDDFLHSVLTDRDYEAGSKIRSGTNS